MEVHSEVALLEAAIGELRGLDWGPPGPVCEATSAPPPPPPSDLQASSHLSSLLSQMLDLRGSLSQCEAELEEERRQRALDAQRHRTAALLAHRQLRAERAGAAAAVAAMEKEVRLSRAAAEKARVAASRELQEAEAARKSWYPGPPTPATMPRHEEGQCEAHDPTDEMLLNTAELSLCDEKAKGGSSREGGEETEGNWKGSGAKENATSASKFNGEAKGGRLSVEAMEQDLQVEQKDSLSDESKDARLTASASDVGAVQESNGVLTESAAGETSDELEATLPVALKDAEPRGPGVRCPSIKMDQLAEHGEEEGAKFQQEGRAATREFSGELADVCLEGKEDGAKDCSHVTAEEQLCTQHGPGEGLGIAVKGWGLAEEAASQVGGAGLAEAQGLLPTEEEPITREQGSFAPQRGGEEECARLQARVQELEAQLAAVRWQAYTAAEEREAEVKSLSAKLNRLTPAHAPLVGEEETARRLALEVAADELQRERESLVLAAKEAARREERRVEAQELIARELAELQNLLAREEPYGAALIRLAREKTNMLEQLVPEQRRVKELQEDNERLQRECRLLHRQCEELRKRGGRE